MKLKKSITVYIIHIGMIISVWSLIIENEQKHGIIINIINYIEQNK